MTTTVTTFFVVICLVIKTVAHTAVTIIDDKLFSPVLPLQGSFLSSELNQRYQQNNNSWEIEKKMVNQLSANVDSCDLESFSSLWSADSFAPPDFLKGLDKTSLLGSSMSVGDKHFVVSASGFDIFGGVVYVFDRLPPSKYKLKRVLKSPLEMNSNFGSSVAVYQDTLLVAANQYSLSDGIVIVYKYLENAYWRETARIQSPFVDDKHDNIWRAFDSSVDKAFGNKVALHGSFAIIATAGNSAFIYEEQPNLRWTINSRLRPQTSSEGFGFSVAISADYAIVGSPNYNGGSGCIYVYQYNSGLSSDSWVLLERFQPHTGQSFYFGSSIDISKVPNSYDKSILLAVGAKGFGKGADVDWNPGYVYMYSLDQSSNKFINETVLESPVGRNSLFGASVALYDNVLAVGAEGFPCGAANGAGFVYYRQPSLPTSNSSFSWVLNSSFVSPSGAGSHFGHAVVLNDLLISFGAYGDDSLRGALYVYDRLAKYDISITFGKGGSTSSVETHVTASNSVQFPWMVVIIIVAATMFCCGSLGMIVYCCCCIEPTLPPSKKKKSKKKGEQQDPSPYTVHSYRGYIDSDDEDAFTVDENGKVVKKNDPKASRKGSYKVFGPGGFEGEVDPTSSSDELGEKKVGTAMDDSDSASATSDSDSSSMGEVATVVKSIHSMRSSLTAGSSYYSDVSSMSYVEQAKAKHRQIKDYAGGSASIISSDGATSKVSFVEQGRSKLQLYRKIGGESVRAGSTETDDASKVSLVEFARAKLDLYKKDEDDDESVSVSSSMSDTKIEQAKAKLELYMKQIEESVMESDVVSRSSSSFVEQAKARLQALKRSDEVGSSSSSLNEEDTTRTSFVSEAKVKYAEVRRAVSSSSSMESDQEALVTKAKARYQTLRTISSSGFPSMAPTESSEEGAATATAVSVPEETVNSNVD